MKIVDRFTPTVGARVIAALGNFDGVHCGHQEILRRAVASARAQGGSSLVITFQPHPLQVIAPGVGFLSLSDFAEKPRLIAAVGVDHLLQIAFTPAFAAQTPDEFVRRTLVEQIGVREVFVGENFAFGRGRSGTVADLASLGEKYGFVVQIVPTVLVDGVAVSSSRIRNDLQSGQVRPAAALLGRRYRLDGPVVPGSGRGQALGYRTANIAPPAGRVVPKDGIYATWVEVEGGCHASVTYIGRRPTFGAGDRLIEAHLLAGASDLYQRNVAIEFVDWIRDDAAFSGPEALAQQIAADVRQAEVILRPSSAGREAPSGPVALPGTRRKG